MIVTRPNFAMSASVAFTIVGNVLSRLQPLNTVHVRMTYPCGGQYQCLSLFSDHHRKHACDFNLSSGRFHVFDGVHDGEVRATKNWPESANYLLAVLSADHGLNRVVDDVIAAIGLPAASRPLPDSGSTALTLGSLLGRFVYDEPIFIENGWVHGLEDYAKWLDEAPEDCIARPYLDSVAGDLWRVQFGDAVAIVDFEMAYLLPTKDAFCISAEIHRGGGSPFLAADRIETHLRSIRRTLHQSD